jgi:hypothetical protein
MHPLLTLRLLPAAGLLLTLTACGNDDITQPPDTDPGTLVVDASASWAFASLSSGQVVSVADYQTTSAWDIGFLATGVMLNGGAAGPGGVTGYCVCQNAGATDAEILAMTPESELSDFEAVTAASIPDDESFDADQLVPAMSGWYTGTGASAAAAPGSSWLVRLRDGASFAKVHVIGLAGATEVAAGEVTIEYAVQPTSDAPFGEVKTLTLGTATPAVDLAAGAAASGETWDLTLDGWNLRLNGGVSGSGSAAATPAAEAFEAIETASVDARAYKADAFAGVFAVHPWYKYNLAGDNRISPTFDVYLVKRDGVVYKLQLVNYYGTAGETRQISLRYARLTS